MLFAARAAQGAFAAALVPAALAIVGATFAEGRDRLRAFSFFGAVQGMGGALGLLVGGALTQYAGWRWCMFVNVPLALAVVAAALTMIDRDGRGARRRYDLVGATLVTTGAALLVLGLTWAGEAGSGWRSSGTLPCLAASLLLGGALSGGRRGIPVRCCRSGSSAIGPAPAAISRPCCPAGACSPP